METGEEIIQGSWRPKNKAKPVNIAIGGTFYDNMVNMVFKRYADDYETIVSVDKEGHEKKEVVYHGKYYELGEDGPILSHLKKSSIGLLALVSILHIAGGCAANPGMYQFAVALPYVLAYFPLIYAIAGALRMPVEERRYRRDEIGLSFDRVKASARILLVLLAAGWIGEIVFLAAKIEMPVFSEFAYFLLETLACGCVYLLLRGLKKVNVQECPVESKSG